MRRLKARLSSPASEQNLNQLLKSKHKFHSHIHHLPPNPNLPKFTISAILLPQNAHPRKSPQFPLPDSNPHHPTSPHTHQIGHKRRRSTLITILPLRLRPNPHAPIRQSHRLSSPPTHPTLVDRKSPHCRTNNQTNILPPRTHAHSRPLTRRRRPRVADTTSRWR
jgi:hypothetical protein